MDLFANKSEAISTRGALGSAKALSLSSASLFAKKSEAISTRGRKKIAFRDFFRFFKDSSFKSVLKIRKNVVKKSRKSHSLKKRAERA